MKKELFIVLGKTHTGKSVTIRGLTGMFTRGECRIETNDGVIDIYVSINALQEHKLTPNDAVRELGEHEKLLIPLHFDGRIRLGHRYPGALDYIQAFMNANFEVSQIVALGDNQDNQVGIQDIQDALPQLPEIRPIDTFERMPNNHAAYPIREAWGWR